MEWISQLQHAINFIESHLLENINYEDAAQSVHMSGYNFHRTFSLIAGMTANEYIRNRRLSLAAQELQATDISVLDAALKYGYDSPESFSKAFSRFHGVTPKQAKREGAPLRLFNPLAIKITLEGGTIMEYKTLKTKGQKFLALVRSFPNEIINDENDRSISAFWDECIAAHALDALRKLRPEGKRDLYGLCSPKLDTQNQFEYGIGILLDEETEESSMSSLPSICRVWETEPAEYVVFSCLGEDGRCISDAWGRFYKEFLPQSGYVQTELTDFELYYEKADRNQFCELWIPVKRA